MIRTTDSDDREGTLRDLAPDLTPMLDVMFILLIFFILTANTVFKALDLTLPEKGASQVESFTEQKKIVLAIYPSGQGYKLNDEAISNFATLRERILQLKAQRPEHTLVIAGDKNVNLEKLLQVLTFLSANNITAANILMNPGE